MPETSGQPAGNPRLTLAFEFVVLVALPLFSRAALFGGTPGASWPQLVALPLWVAALLSGRRAWRSAGRGAWPTFALYAAGVLGGVAIVVLRDHRVGSDVFFANLGEAVLGWYGAWSTTDSMYFLRSAATYLSGPVFFLAVRSLFRERSQLRAFDALTLWGGAVAAVVATLQAVSGRGLSFEPMPGVTPVGRAAGLLPDPNALGSYLALTAAFGAIIWLERVGNASATKRFSIAAIACGWGTLLCVALWFSGSRAALLALIGVFLIATLASRPAGKRSFFPSGSRRSLAIVASVVLVLLGVTYVATSRGLGSSPEQSRTQRLLSGFDMSQPAATLLRGRPVLWAAGATMILDEPVAGIGAGQFGAQVGYRVPVGAWGAVTAENAHNYYLQVAAEIGIIGLAGLLLTLTSIFVVLWRDRANVRSRAAFYGATAWCITCLAGHPQLIPSLQLFFWGFLALATTGKRLPGLGVRPLAVSVLVALLSARVLVEALIGGPGPALYAAGLYGREPRAPGEQVERWTSARARLDVRREGSVLEVPFLVAHEEMPVTVRAVVGPWTEERRYSEGGWKKLTYYFPDRDGARVQVSLGTSPLVSAPGDSRDLGVMLAPLRWTQGRLRQPVGTYDAEVDADGRRFYWTGRIACFPLGSSEEIVIEIRADHPDVELRPVEATLLRGSSPPQVVALGDRSWVSIRVPAAPAAGEVLCVQTSRTWNPSRSAGSDDSRDLGVAVTLPEEILDAMEAGR